MHTQIRNSLISLALLCGLGLSQAQAFTHPCIPTSLHELNTIKANLDKEPWKSGYAGLADASTSQLSWHQEGPWETVSRTPDVNLTYWKHDMVAVYNLACMWYFTGNEAYAQKGHDIILSWANKQENFGGHETPLSLGDFAVAYAGGASILRGTWPGWTEADTATVKKYFENVTWPTTIAGYNTIGPANKGMLTVEAGIAVAAFLDDTEKFNHCIDLYRTSPASGLFNTLPIGEMGETGRDLGHSYGTLIGMAVISEIAWKQGIDLYSDLDNRLLAVGEYYARNSLALDNPFVPFGSIDYTYYANNSYYFTPDNTALLIIQNAYKNRKGLPTPWIDRKLESLGAGGNLMYAKTADFSTATPPPAVVRPPVSLASSGLTLTTLGGQTAGRSVSYSNGEWTMAGLGGGVWNDKGRADDCQFAYQTMTGDCAMVVRITSATASGSNNGKVGLMIRDSLSATVSQRAWIGIVPNASPNLVESRQDGWTDNWGGGNWARRSQPLPPGMPYWLKIERRGDMIATYTSQDGTSWAANINSYYADLPSTLYVGMFICSGTATTNTATFDHVAFTGGSGGLVTTPAAPATLLASGSSKVITLRWVPSFGATAYDLLRSTTSGSGYTVIARDLTADKTSFVDTDVAAGRTYYYVARAKNSAGTSGNSPEFGAALLPAPMVNLAFSGSSSASFNGNSAREGSDKVFDQDAGSKWFGYNSPTGWLQYDFGENNAQVVKRYTINSADIADRDPKDWTFLGSQDGSNWTTLDSQSNQSFEYRMQLNTYNLANTTAYRYYRLDITANNGAGGTAVAELGLWGDSGRVIYDGRYVLVNRNSNKVMHRLSSGSGLVQSNWNGRNSQQWDISWQGNGLYRVTPADSSMATQLSSGSTKQCCKVVPDSDGFFHLTSASTGLVLDVAGGSTADGANIVQKSYTGSDSQQWMPSLATGTAPTGVRLRTASY